MLCDPGQNTDLGCANRNQCSTTTAGYTQPTQWVYLEYPAWVIEEAVPLDPRLGDVAALPKT